MEKSFDFGALLKNHEKKHKSKPSQFRSVAGGVQKRLETNLKYRKSSRLSVFDSIRNLSRCGSPVPVSSAQMKVEHRRQQLEKWKEEKEKRKKEEVAQKKKPFIAGVPHAPLKFVPPPPPPKPSTSGRVTRSQTSNAKLKEAKGTKPSKSSQSFAPKNAMFKAPEIKTLTKLPSLAPTKATKNKKVDTITFNPVLPNTVKEVKLTHSKSQKDITKAHKQERTAKGKETKPSNTKITKKTIPVEYNDISSTMARNSRRSVVESNLPVSKITSKKASQSTDSQSSYEEKDIPKISHKPVNRKNTRKSFAGTDSPIVTKKTPRKSLLADQTPSQSSSEEKSSPKLSLNASSCLPNSPIISKKTLRKSLLKSRNVTPKNPVPKSESSSEERLRSPKSQTDVQVTPVQIVEEAKMISPCVTMSRGKDNARRELKKKLQEGLLDADASDMDSVDHFRQQLASEMKRMTEMCETWDRISEQTVLPDSVQEAVLSAVGQARLLMSQKLQQFATLVERCARPEPGTGLVTPADLHGFWDMVFMQVENVEMRFKKLEELRARGWVEPQPVQVKKKVHKSSKKTAKPATGPSRLREMIAAARKAKKDQESEPQQLIVPAAEADSKTFEAGFFSVRSPVKSPLALSTPAKKNSLLKAVLSSEAKKASASKNSASFAMLRASVLSKNIECDGISVLPQTPVNLYATPGRSILKANNSTKKSEKKSIKMVLFDRSDADIDYHTPESDITDKNQDLNMDSDLSHMDQELKVQDKENRRKTLVRQDAEDRSPVMTRSRRKSLNTEATPRRSARKVLQDSEENLEVNTRSSRRRQSGAQAQQ